MLYAVVQKGEDNVKHCAFEAAFQTIQASGAWYACGSCICRFGYSF